MFVLIGGGGHGKVIGEILDLIGVDEYLFYDKFLVPDASKLLTNVLPESNQDTKFVICIGDNKKRKENVFEILGNFGIVIHPSSIISKSAFIGVGSVVLASTVINSFVKIGQHCIINTNSTIEHDCILEDFVHVSPGATICGNVSIGCGSHIGAGSVVIPGIKIGSWSVIGAGAVVIDDVPDNATVVGNPARPILRKK
jgi:sugar O-acyltransferase (sialic acid O-acetyltransferase NeuD family)